MDRQELFDQILKNRQITVLFQPIIDLKTGEPIGYEALSRGPEGTEFASPLSLIRAANEYGRLCELELLFKETALAQADRCSLGKLLFLNVEPDALGDSLFSGCLSVSFENHRVAARSVVLELTERSVMVNYDVYRQNILDCRKTGVDVAADRAGTGFNSLTSISQLGVKYIKIDQSLIRGIGSDSGRQAILSSFITLSSLTNTRLVAEGIETADELKTLLRLGISAGQGYFLAKPAPVPAPVSPEAKSIIRWHERRAFEFPKKRTHYIGNIAERIPCYGEDTTCREAKKILENSQVEGICIVDTCGVAGLLMKKQLDAMLASQYGFSLFAERPVSSIMDAGCIVVDYYTPIKEVSDLVFTRSRQKSYDNVVVTKESAYYGVVTVINLLRYAMEIQYNSALECNPLTQLPGNTMINERLSEIIRKPGDYSVLYFDLNHFKAYNDVYGFGRGDALILLTKNVIASVIEMQNGFNTFFGHIGGDDFVVASDFDIEECVNACRAVIGKFDLSVSDYYNEKDRNNGFITTESRNHHMKTYPLTQISIGGIHGNFRCFDHTHELAEYVGRLKKQAKDYPKSTYVIEQLTSRKIYSNAF